VAVAIAVLGTVGGGRSFRGGRRGLPSAHRVGQSLGASGMSAWKAPSPTVRDCGPRGCEVTEINRDRVLLGPQRPGRLSRQGPPVLRWAVYEACHILTELGGDALSA
jgi:hypothetical protein